MLKKIINIALLFCGMGAFAQLQNANWALAEGGGYNFVNQASFSSSMSALDNIASASVSDREGNLLFYTDGVTVWDASHNAMANGTGLMGQGGDFTQNIVIVPNPADINRYYIVYFRVGQVLFGSSFTGLRYSEVDMSTNSVIAGSRDTPLKDENGIDIDSSYDPAYGKITTAAHGNGLDYWIIVEVGNRILSYLVDHNGISANPVMNFSPLPTTLYEPPTGMFQSSGNGPMKISPSNDRILVGYSRVNDPSYINRIYEGIFDDMTGVVSDFVLLNSTLASQGIELTGAEFSPDSQTVHRFYSDYIETVVVSSQVVMIGPRETIVWDQTQTDTTFNVDGRNAQRAIDGKIYFEDTAWTSTDPPGLMGVINNPNGPVYDIEFNTIDVNSSGFYVNNIPTWVQQQDCLRYLVSNQTFTDLTERERLWYIESTDVFDGSSARGTYHAGNYVELNPGFETQNNAQFAAYIEGCSGDYAYRMPIRTPGKVVKNTMDKQHPKRGKLLIFPNPASSYITLQNDKEPLGAVTIHSLDGRQVYRESHSGDTADIDVKYFSKGIYIISTQSPSGKMTSSIGRAHV